MTRRNEDPTPHPYLLKGLDLIKPWKLGNHHILDSECVKSLSGSMD